MRICRGLGRGLSIVVLLLACEGFGQQGSGASKGPQCAAAERRLQAVEAQIAQASDLARQAALVGFLDTAGDDPENCVTTSAQTRLIDVEKRLIRLDVQAGTPAQAGTTVQGSSLAPDWLYHCAAIDRSTQRCHSPTPYADDIPMDPDGHLLEAHSIPRARDECAYCARAGTGLQGGGRVGTGRPFRTFRTACDPAFARRSLSTEAAAPDAGAGADRLHPVRGPGAIPQGGVEAPVAPQFG